MTTHIEAKKSDIAATVIMPGDPLRAKMIAETYLKDYKLVNTVRNVLAYTGYYNDKLVTIFASGMGIPSMGIYSYELYNFYGVENIIRIGTCGSFSKNIKLFDLIIPTEAYSNSTFAYSFNGCLDKEMFPDEYLFNKIIKQADGLKFHTGPIITSDVFDVYVDHEDFMSRYPKREFIGSEMETFGLFFIAKLLNKKAACILTVVDAFYDKRKVSSEERQNSLNEMIELALKSL